MTQSKSEGLDQEDAGLMSGLSTTSSKAPVTGAWALVVLALLVGCDGRDYPRAECAISTVSRQHDSTFQRVVCDWSHDPFHRADSTTESIVGKKTHPDKATTP
jgi:hypothetical protein